MVLSVQNNKFRHDILTVRLIKRFSNPLKTKTSLTLDFKI